MQFYTKNDAGEVIEATPAQIEELFKEKSDKIVAKKLAIAKEKELEKIRPELEEQIRKETTDKIRAEVEAETKTKLDEATKGWKDAEMRIRRKTIAAEYGFKPDVEEFLGNGTDEEMRAKADALKSNFGSQTTSTTFPEKKTTNPPEGSGFVKLVGKTNE